MIPLLILSDAPTSGTGLGRITADLASRIAANLSDVYRVATIGFGGIISKNLPYQQYAMEGKTPDEVIMTLPEVWQDWAGNEPGIIFTVWDISRIGWLLRPDGPCGSPALKGFLQNRPFQLWTYLPIHAEGPNGKMTYALSEALKGSDRILAYGKWGADVIDRTRGFAHHPYLPHGIDTGVFYERDRTWSRKTFISYTNACTIMGNLAERVKGDEILISIIATNQARKDFALGIETVAILAQKYNVRLWIKTDVLERHWSIPALLFDFGLADRAMITTGTLTDDEMARAYSASDLVLGIAPEGFGYAHVESLACGTPCITGSYAGGAELVPRTMRVDPVASRFEGVWSEKRPVYNPEDWAKKAESWLEHRATMDMKYDWVNLWPEWEKWFRQGVGQ